MRNTLKQNEEHSQIKKIKNKLFVLLSSKKKKKETEQAHKKAQHQS